MPECATAELLPAARRSANTTVDSAENAEAIAGLSDSATTLIGFFESAHRADFEMFSEARQRPLQRRTFRPAGEYLRRARYSD